MKRYVAWAIILFALVSLTIVFVETRPQLKGKKIAMVIAQRQFEGTEFKEPKDIFEREGAEIIVACNTLADATSMGFDRLVVKPDILIKDIKVIDYDAIVFIGGFGVGEYYNDPDAHRIVRQALKQRKILAAICMAPVVLANAGLLESKRATCAQSYNIQSKGAIATGKDVERDGNIITANGPGAAKQFGGKIVSALSAWYRI
jgi:protease I